MKSTPVVNAKILLVDDNRDGLVVRRSLLQELGFRVEITGNCEEALKLVAASRFDVVVTDYRMPRMNGTELIERIRKVDPNVRVILLSGFVDPLGLTEQSTGADTVVEKSSREPAHLVRAVKRLLNRPPQRKPPGRQSGGPRPRPASGDNLAH
jgi:CheY-like chemotaxis protein